jgi:hypothetical protein
MCAFPVQALEDSNALQFLSDELREKLLQTLLERRLKQFTLDVCTQKSLCTQLFHRLRASGQ